MKSILKYDRKKTVTGKGSCRDSKTTPKKILRVYEEYAISAR